MAVATARWTLRPLDNNQLATSHLPGSTKKEENSNTWDEADLAGGR